MKAVRLIPGLRGLTYEQRLEKLKLNKVIDRRFRVDMIQTYKIITIKDDTNREAFFQMAEERGSRTKEEAENFKKKSRKGEKDKCVFPMCC